MVVHEGSAAALVSSSRSLLLVSSLAARGVVPGRPGERSDAYSLLISCRLTWPAGDGGTTGSPGTRGSGSMGFLKGDTACAASYTQGVRHARGPHEGATFSRRADTSNALTADSGGALPCFGVLFYVVRCAGTGGWGVARVRSSPGSGWGPRWR